MTDSQTAQEPCNHIIVQDKKVQKQNLKIFGYFGKFSEIHTIVLDTQQLMHHGLQRQSQNVKTNSLLGHTE